MHTLEIIATGRKNPEAKGTEVWFRGLKGPQGGEIPAAQLQIDEAWQRREENGGTLLVCAQDQPARIRWQGEAEGPLRLVLGSHEWSGQVAIDWNGQRQEVDLYSSGGTRIVDLPLAGANGAGNGSEEASMHKAKALTSQVRRLRVVQTARQPSVWHFLNPLTLGRDLWRQRGLIWQFTLRELQSRYKGSFMGLVWTLLTPLLMLAVYTFVFSVIFDIRLTDSSGTGSQVDFALRMFCGLIMFNVFSECVNRAPYLIVYSPNYVKKVVFPLEVLPLAVVGASLFTALTSIMILFIGELALLQKLPPLQALYLPLVLLPLVLLTAGFSWFLASLGVFLRDLTHILSVVTQVLFYVTPIFYSVTAVPEFFRPFVLLNPLTLIIENARNTLYLGRGLNWSWWGGVMLVGFVVMQLGYAWLQKTKKGFADVL